MSSCRGDYIMMSHCACADAADKAKAEGLASLNLGQKIRAFISVLQPAYWQALSVVCLLYFARFDASFITLRARTVSLAAHVACPSCHL